MHAGVGGMGGMDNRPHKLSLQLELSCVVVGCDNKLITQVPV